MLATFWHSGQALNGIKTWGKDRRTGKIEVTPAQTSLRMGDSLDGRIQLDLEEPINPCSVGVSLELLAYGHSILSNNESGTDRPQILSCCRVGEIIDSRSAMNAGASPVRLRRDHRNARQRQSGNRSHLLRNWRWPGRACPAYGGTGGWWYPPRQFPSK